MSLTYSPKIATDGLLMCLDPSQNKSYPINLPVKDVLILWLDAADDTTFSYSSGTVVSQWRDKSPLNNHANQSTVANQPNRSTSINSRKTITFDGTNDFFDGTNNLNLSNGYCAFVVIKSSATGERDIITSNPLAVSTDLYLYQRASDGRFGNWSEIYTTNPISTGTWYLLSVNINSSGAESLYLNGTLQGSSTRTLTSTKGYRIAASSSGAEFWNGEIAEIIIFGKNLSDVELKRTHSYLGQKWGILNTDRSIIDLSGNQKDALLGNGTTTCMPKFDYDNKGTLFFDDVDDTVLTNIPITSTPALSNFTYEIWTKLTNFPTVAPVNVYGSTTRAGFLMGASAYGGAGLLWYGNATATACTLYGFIRGTDGYRSTSGYSLSLNQYYHLVLVNNYGANKLQLFVNGSLFNETSTATAEYDAGNAAGAGNIGIAKAQIDGGGTQNYSNYAGRVGLARIYSRALSANEILQNYEAQKSRFSNTLISQGLVLNLDAGNPYSYAGAGTTWYDASANSINASATGTPTYSTLYGGTINFYPSVSTYYNTATVSTLNLGAASFTMEAWVYLDAVTGSDNVYRGIISLGTNSSNYVYIAKWRSGLYSGLYVQYVAGAATITGVYQANEYNPVSRWSHVVATKSSNVLSFYVNGTLVYSVSDLNTTFTGNSSFYIGVAHNSVASMYGYMGEARLYNISFSAAQVLQNYNATKGRFGL